MAWETRGRRRYRYVSRRIGDRVVKEYYGHGVAAGLLDRVEAQERRAAAEDARAIASLRRATASADALAEALDVIANRQFEATLIAAGYRRVNFTWRRRRMTATANLTIADVDRGDEVQGLEEHMARARSGVASAHAPRRAELDATGLSTGPGDLAAEAEASWITLISGQNADFAEALAQQATTMRVELQGPSPTPTESILARRVVVAWLIANHADTLCAQGAAGRTIRHENALVDHSERAARRLTAAVSALETLRKLIGAGGRTGAASRSAPGPAGARPMPAIRPA